MIKKGLSRLGIMFLYLVSLLPFWLLYLIADVLFVIIYYVIGYRRKVVRQNLVNSFPNKTDAERRLIECRYFRYLCEMMVETIKLATISEKEVLRRMTTDERSLELVGRYLDAGRNMIGAVGHYGNWELAALRFSLITNHRRVIVYKPLSNKTYEDYFTRMRSRFGATLVAMKQTMRKLVEFRNEPTFTVLVGDQTPSREEVHYFTKFLNQQTAVFLGVEKLAKATNAVVVFCDVRRIKRGYYSFTFATLTEEPKATAPYQITEAHVAYLENMISTEPAYWLWSHRRWKFKPEDFAR